MNWPGRRIGAAALIVDESGRVLLVRHAYGPLNWELPGGASEPGESVVETARELREETGLEAVAEALTGIYWDADRDAHHFVFRCSVQGGEPKPTSSEITDAGYWDPGELPRPISDFTLRRIEDGLGGNPQRLPVSVPARTILG